MNIQVTYNGFAHLVSFDIVSGEITDVRADDNSIWISYPRSFEIAARIAYSSRMLEMLKANNRQLLAIAG